MPLFVVFAGCAITVKPLAPEKKVVYKTRTKAVHSKAKPHQTPTPVPDMPPYPPPHYDEIIRRTHPTPTISPFNFL